MRQTNTATDPPEPEENWTKIYSLLIVANILIILLFIWFTNYFS